MPDTSLYCGTFSFIGAISACTAYEFHFWLRNIWFNTVVSCLFSLKDGSGQRQLITFLLYSCACAWFSRSKRFYDNKTSLAVSSSFFGLIEQKASQFLSHETAFGRMLRILMAILIKVRWCSISSVWEETFSLLLAKWCLDSKRLFCFGIFLRSTQQCHNSCFIDVGGILNYFYNCYQNQKIISLLWDVVLYWESRWFACKINWMRAEFRSVSSAHILFYLFLGHRWRTQKLS